MKGLLSTCHVGDDLTHHSQFGSFIWRAAKAFIDSYASIIDSDPSDIIHFLFLVSRPNQRDQSTKHLFGILIRKTAPYKKSFKAIASSDLISSQVSIFNQRLKLLLFTYFTSSKGGGYV